MIDALEILTIAKCLTEDITSSKVKKEYERRYSLKKLPEGADYPSKIKQGFLFQKNAFSLRVREEITDSKPKYTLTCKFYDKNDEAEVEITKEMFNKLWPETIKSTQMKKTRYRYKDWEIDDIDGEIIAEIETDTKTSEVTIPKSFDVIKRLQ